ncbi:MAG: hypothetical protein ACXU85_13620, partial [Xanthobacteraceae bacterium]
HGTGQDPAARAGIVERERRRGQRGEHHSEHPAAPVIGAMVNCDGAGNLLKTLPLSKNPGLRS